ncbi:homeobox protein LUMINIDEPENDENS-like [Phoenix dactylifera]|uniref:Homeobox protein LUMINIDEPENDENS-like n=1 Tax=Phoenix dactylifera TaxID=42345 RepID=A0A8B7C1X0_PHODC|nr:homeobox protein LUMINIDEPENDENS-like [Phoenix dactylifera]
MALVPGVSEGAVVELDVDSSVESLAALLDSQRELFRSQIDQLQKLVAAQCKLTGVNPLSQEMAAGALSIKIGKMPGDLLNPKAVNYMQSVFSVKDTIGKKETREISALCGITVTQVREFFAAQRSRVRKLVHLSQEKAMRVEASRASSNGCSFSALQSVSAESMISREQIPVAGSAMIINSLRDGQQDTSISTDLKNVEEGPSCSALEEIFPGIDSNDKKFVDNIFNLMRKEETFSGQVKLVDWILQVHNSAVLIWFLTKGGLTILATWLSQAAHEEQTTVLLVIFKVLCHLPLHKALPVQMSAVLQTVNRLRFYRTSDISNRARTLLSRWSKLFVRTQALKKPLICSSKGSQKEIIRKQRISEILSDESWQSNIDIPEDILALTEDMENNRKSESKQAVKLLPSSADELSKKHGRSVSLSRTKERRKVLLVEQPDRKTSGRSMQVARAVPSNHSRPMSADDIQKAKLRAMFMQNKYGKADTSNSENKLQKTEDNHEPSPSQTSNMLSASRVHQLPPLEKDGGTKASISTANIRPNESETLVIPRPNTTSQEQLLEKLKCSQIQWQTPPEIINDSKWRVGAGENSKEVEVQTQRNQREKETFYSKPEDIPLNAKEPWDLEMDFDDSLTPEIPTEPLPDADITEDSVCSPCNVGASDNGTPAATSAPPPPPPPISNGNPEPDLELLTVLLKNPELVFALTSGQAKSMTSEQMVALLDVLKRNGVGLAELVNRAADGLEQKPQEPKPTSLPSPTPPSDPAARAGWRSEFPIGPSTPAAVLPVVAMTQAPGLGLHPHTPTTHLSSMSQTTVTINPTSQHHPSLNFLPKRLQAPSAHQIRTSVYPLQHRTVPEPILPANQYTSVPRQESFNHNPSPMTTLPAFPSRSQPPTFSPRIPAWPPGAAASATSVGRPNPTPDPWIGRSNDVSEGPVPFLADQVNHNARPKGPVPPLFVPPRDRNGILDDGSEVETWSPEGSPVRLRGRDYFSGTTRDHGRNHRPEWPRRWDAGNRDRHRPGSKQRWPGRDRDRRR